eukprot:TRINITY_DN162_c0_g1_i1.p1 TRINITY_DN162_c0_g1~~TRINITY_DN162_c0_g1_i1.p1  ORF type:complete len:272 (-),score=30.00 TRINITY_DN162_c0_g1_i1:60-875(-)
MKRNCEDLGLPAKRTRTVSAVISQPPDPGEFNEHCYQLCSAIPEEIWSLLMCHCDVQTVLSFGGTSKDMFKLANIFCVVNYTNICWKSESFLRKFTSLTELYIPPKTDINPQILSEFTNLEVLDWRTLKSVDQSLAYLTSLKKLTLASHCYISQVPSLHELIISEKEELPTPKLASLKIVTDHVVRVIYESPQQLEVIEEFGLTADPFSTRSTDFSEISLSWLTNLHNLGSFSDVTKLTSLECLTLHYSTGIDQQYYAFLTHMIESVPGGN